MGTLLKILSILIVIAIGTGFYFKGDGQLLLGNRIIGIAVLAGTFVLLPIFLFHSWKGKDVNKYMLTDENIKKMKENNKKKRY